MRAESHPRWFRAVLLIAAAAAGAGRAGADEAPSPCQQEPGYRQLDFWVGEWDVYEGASRVGKNRIERILRDCALVENWTDAEGREGKSLFFYDRFTAVWKQVWIYDVGQLKEKVRVSAPAPGDVRFQGRVAVRPGVSVLDRTTLTPLPEHRVRQVIEISRDDGSTWQKGFDAVYVPRGSAPPTPAASGHDAAFWKTLAKQGFAIPAGEPVDALLLELNVLLGSPDPVLRDECAYSAAAAWIYRDQRVPPQTLRQLLGLWSANLRAGLGEVGTDTVFLRSFSALDLSLLAALDHKQPFLTAGEFSALLSSALEYLAGERDLRAFDPAAGWMHATAHTADLLKFLARNPRLASADQERILEGVRAKLASAGQVFGHGENERLAAAVQSLVLRDDFDAPAFGRFLAALVTPAKGLWDGGPLVDPRRFAAAQNAKDLLRSLLVGLLLRDPAGRSAPVREEIVRALGEIA